MDPRPASPIGCQEDKEAAVEPATCLRVVFAKTSVIGLHPEGWVFFSIGIGGPMLESVAKRT